MQKIASPTQLSCQRRLVKKAKISAGLQNDRSTKSKRQKKMPWTTGMQLMTRTLCTIAPVKQRAVVQQEVVLETPNDDKVEGKEVEFYDVEVGDAKIIDSAFQINTIDNYEFKDMEEHVVTKGCLGKFHTRRKLKSLSVVST